MPLATVIDPQAPMRFVMDTGALYFVSNHQINRLPLAAGNATPLTPVLTAAHVGSPVVGDQVVVWTDSDGLHKVPKAGGAVETLTTSITDTMLAVVDTQVISVDFNNYGMTAPVFEVPLGGGEPTLLHSPLNAYSIVADPDNGRVLIAGGDGLTSIDVHTGEAVTWFGVPSQEGKVLDSRAYFISDAQTLPDGIHTGSEAIFSAQIPNGTALQILTGLFVTVAADANNVYFDGRIGDAPGPTSVIGWAPRNGGAGTALVTSDTVFTGSGYAYLDQAIGTDDAFIYFPQRCQNLMSEGRIVRIPKPTKH